MNEEDKSKNMELSRYDIHNLNGIRKWALFLSIIGFISIAILVLFGFSFGTIMSQLGGDETLTDFPTFLFGIIYLVIGIIYFFPILFLFKFAVNAQKGINFIDSGFLSKAFKKLKDHYTYIGILFAIMISLYLFFGIVIAVMAVFMN
jgi:hypothetical protein